MLVTPEQQRVRLRISIQGAVQGVGFRPFVYRLAHTHRLTGWVSNSVQGVIIEVEGQPAALDDFLSGLSAERPPNAVIQSIQTVPLIPLQDTSFEIRTSQSCGEKSALILPDIAICPDCLRDIFDPNNRRYRYPFTNCTHCGPRYTIIRALPYDRPATSMSIFPMCKECQREYDDPLDRRFHAQPNACPRCGPHLELWDGQGIILASHDDALMAAAEAICQGMIVAVKGLGGFHLIVDARNEEAVERLRQRKHRQEKPFALMFPSLDSLKTLCEVSPLEEQLLTSAQSPIVLLHRRVDKSANLSAWGIAPSVAPENPYLGVMLPYTPLYHLLLAELGFPMVATSGNRSDEPICIDEYNALLRLAGIADLFLVHNRPILRPVDDSIVRVINGREMVMRRARGYAPFPIELEDDLPPILAVGGHLKNTIAQAVGRRVFISQHIGDLETAQSVQSFEGVIQTFAELYELQAQVIACDLHPDYRSTHYAERCGLPLVRVQHHCAHALACMAEHHLKPPVLGIIWDGTGYGTDGTIWGGEFLTIQENGFERSAHLRPFRLPGGEAAVREPRRSALGLLYELFGDDLSSLEDLPPIAAFSPSELTILQEMLAKGINAPLTSSAGRLFDAVASLLGLCQRVSFEGQAAMAVEYAAEGVQTDDHYDFRFANGVLDWGLMIHEILKDDSESGVMAARFQNTLVSIMVTAAGWIGLPHVVLSGGCFQNRYLTERAIRQLEQAGFQVYWHQRIPPNDGGIALGQVMAARGERI
jgi:hydrogenase maturation protein HypF